MKNINYQKMNYFLDDASDLEEEQVNINILGGPSKSPQKSKPGKATWHSDNIELGNSLMNLKANNNSSKISNNKSEKHKNKSNGKHHHKSSSKTSRKSINRQLLMDRLKMYANAEQVARETGDMKKAGIINKDVQILNALIAHHDSGNIIDPDNIPPEIKTISHDSKLGVTFKESAEVALIPYTTELESTSNSETDSEEANLEKILGILKLRRDQYKISVVQNKGVGNVPRALEHLNIIKMFDSLIRHIELGEKVDLNDLPGPPECPICHIYAVDNPREVEKQCITINNSESSVEEQIMSHSTVLQGLQERLHAYEILKMNAKKENNVGEALRIDQIIKIYKEAIRLHRSRKHFPIDELPSPPGFAPIHNLKSTITPNKPSRF